MLGLNICLVSFKKHELHFETNLNLFDLITFSFYRRALFICKVLIELSQLPGADPGFSLGGGAPLRNDATDR